MFRSLQLLMLLFILSLTTASFAQITITSSDLTFLGQIGTARVSNTDTTAKTVNIGAKGTSSWDFSALTANIVNNLTSVDPATTPYKNDFPKATAAYHFNQLYQGVQADSYTYYGFDTNYVYYGTESSGSPITGTTVVSRIVETPAEIVMKLPLTFQSNWTQTVKETNDVMLNGTPFQSSHTDIVTTYTVDAYGPVIFPGGKAQDALRLKRDEKMTTTTQTGSTYDRIISYSFFTKTGDALVVLAADTTSADTGKIIISSASWTTGTTSPTAVGNEKQQVHSYALDQNYPNPFNPTTIISYSVAENSPVSLKVYDVTGREVATLFNGEQPAGNYKVSFNAATLPSGLYFARLNAGSFTKTIKMMVLK